MLLSMAVFTASADEVLPSEDFEEENGVFHIENASDMLAFAGMAGWYEWYAGKTVSIDANIDMTGVAWTMVASFKGTLEGNGNCIKNLKIEGAGQLGIFKELNGATIKNLRILDSSVKTTAEMAGGIAVLASNATSFENVYIDSTVETPAATGTNRSGGFIGYTNADASVTFKNCVFDTKDAFWHAKNVTVEDSVVKGEYLAWYAENIRFVHCKISGTQPLCYVKGLVLEDCEMEDCDLSFERSEVEADIIGHIDSVKNPITGHITADSIGDIILEEDIIVPGECAIKTR